MIDLRSDTVTKPTDEMRDAARSAVVGDDVFGEDPAVNDLEARAAEIVGMEAALFVPTGTMGNQVAALTHTEPGQEVIVERRSHVYVAELGGLATNAGLQVRPLDGDERGIFTPEGLADAYIDEDLHRAGTGLVCLENTHNFAGGTAIPPSAIDDVAGTARDFGVPVHLDGARLFNAATALDVPARRLARNVDSVMFCLSKGLGAPVGSILAGSADFVAAARRNRKRFGGGMRQAGVIAAPGLVALESRAHLARDHENARVLADGLDALDGLAVRPPETNIVLVETGALDVTADRFLAACEHAGVGGVPFGTHTVRFCTHRDVDRDAIEAAIDGVAAAVDEVA